MNKQIKQQVYFSGDYDLKNNSLLLHILSFAVGLISFFNVNYIGEIYPAEIVLVLMIFFFANQKKELLKNKMFITVIVFGFLWLLSQVITDLIRATPLPDLLRGWASISLFLLEFVGLYLLISNSPKRIIYFLVGYALSGFLQIVFLPSIYFEAHPWKFGFALPVTLILLVVISSFGKNNFRKLGLIMPLFIFLAMLSFYLDYRSLGAIILLTVTLSYLRLFWSGQTFFVHSIYIRIVLVLGLLFCLSSGIVYIYDYSAKQGLFGEQANYRYQSQTGGDLGILFGGRIEVLASVPAIIDSPFIGHGSWAKDYYYRMYLYDLIQLGYNRTNEEIRQIITQSDLIPAHSHLSQAWVWAGLFGAIFWLVVLWMIIKTLTQVYRYPHQLITIVLFFGLLSMWDVIFSPFGALMRLQWAFRLCLFILSINLSLKIKWSRTH